MLELKGVTKTIGDKTILTGVNVTFGANETVAVLGPNGAGKSTLFKCAVGLMPPTSGEIWVNGEKVKKNALEVRKLFGLLGHETFLYNQLTAIENLLFYASLYKIPSAPQMVKRLLKEVGLQYFADVSIQSFSRGMLQRLAIARVLLADPRILLLDEPHTGLDQEAVALLNAMVQRKQSEGRTIILITHDFEQAFQVCNRVLVVVKGKVRASAEMKDFSTLEQLKQWYEEVVNTG